MSAFSATGKIASEVVERSPDGSWRMSTHSSCKKMSHRRLTSACKELLQRSPEFVDARSFPRSGGRSHKTPDVASDYESCSSSLQSLNFDSDQEHPKSIKKNTKTKVTSLSARKKLQFEKMLDFDDENNFQSPRNKIKTTPISSLKTPTENASSTKNSPPKRASHNRRPLLSKDNNISPETMDNITDLSNGDVDYELGQKRLRSEVPKVRMSLFNDSPDKVIPVKSFYSKTDKNVSKVRSLPTISKSVYSKKPVKESKSSRHRSVTYNRLRRHKRTEINKGVCHGIRKPKVNRSSFLTKAKALRLSLDLIDNSPLNDYIEKFMSSNGNNVTKNTFFDANTQNRLNVSKADSSFTHLQANTSGGIIRFNEDNVAEIITYSEDENNDNADSSDEHSKKKFFKSSQGLNKKATVRLPGVKLQVKSGKLIMPKHKLKPLNEATVVEQNIAKHYAAMHKDVTELLNEEDDLPEQSAIDALLNQWSEEVIPETEPHVALCDGEVYKKIENAEQLLNTRNLSPVLFYEDSSSLQSELKTTPSTDLEYTESNSTDTAYVSDSSSQHFENNYGLLPVDEGFIVVEDIEITEMPESTDIESEIRRIEENIVEIAKKNNINPDVLLSPTTQMCTMTSGLVLNSPISSNAKSSLTTDSNVSLINPDDKLYPMFQKISSKTKRQIPESITAKMPANKKIKLSSVKDQYLLDAGQKKFGATQCAECGIIYQIGDAVDENDHMTYHSALDILKFPGWKSERLCGRWEEGRVIVVAPGDPTSHWQRVSNLLERVVHPQLGYAAPLSSEKSYKVYLYIEKKQIVGCLVAEELHRANKLMCDENVECCSNEFYPVKCGISRIWTHKAHRRKRIATNLLNSMRLNFFYGHVLLCEELAFSSPTPMGRSFAEKYTGTPSFYVYLN